MNQLRPDIARLVEQAQRPPWIDPFDPVGARTGLRASSKVADLPRPPGVTSSDFSIPGRERREIGVRLYAPPRDVGVHVVLFLHGGGWVMGDLDTHDGLVGAICAGLEAPVLAVDYRLAPEHPFPAALHDARDALAWIGTGPEELPGPPRGLILAGDSAGGNLAASLAVTERPGLPMAALWTMYSSFDMDADGGSLEAFSQGPLLTRQMLDLFRAAYFPTPEARRYPEASPLRAEDLGHVPPSLVFAAEFDPLRDQSRAFAARLAEHGVPLRYREARGSVHGCLCRRAVAPSGQRDFEACIADLRALLDRGGDFASPEGMNQPDRP